MAAAMTADAIGDGSIERVEHGEQQRARRDDKRGAESARDRGIVKL
jgi:hypothetical protein